MIRNFYSIFREYEDLMPEYKRICDNINGIGTVVGLGIYWLGWLNLMKWYFGTIWDSVGGQQGHLLSEAVLIGCGLPLSLWGGVIFAGAAYAATRKIQHSDAISLTIRFIYPRHWLY